MAMVQPAPCPSRPPGQGLLCPGSLSLTEAPASPHPSPALRCSPAFTFPHPINPMAYQQILSQQRGLGSAFGHTPPLIQPSPTFLAQQPMALTSISAVSTQLSSGSNCLGEANQVGGPKEQRWPHKGRPLPTHAGPQAGRGDVFWMKGAE